MSLVNTAVLPFKATAFAGDRMMDLTDADLKGHWSLVLFFPGAFTKVCPTELVDLAERYEEFKRLGVEIYAVTTDQPVVLEAWHDSSEDLRRIAYPMVGDPTHVIAKNFDVYQEAFGKAERSSFIVNPEGKIVAIDHQIGQLARSTDEMIRKLEGLQFLATHPGEICPAKWRAAQDVPAPELNLKGII